MTDVKVDVSNVVAKATNNVIVLKAEMIAVAAAVEAEAEATAMTLAEEEQSEEDAEVLSIAVLIDALALIAVEDVEASHLIVDHMTAAIEEERIRRVDVATEETEAPVAAQESLKVQGLAEIPQYLGVRVQKDQEVQDTALSLQDLALTLQEFINVALAMFLPLREEVKIAANTAIRMQSMERTFGK